MTTTICLEAGPSIEVRRPTEHGENPAKRMCWPVRRPSKVNNKHTWQLTAHYDELAQYRLGMKSRAWKGLRGSQRHPTSSSALKRSRLLRDYILAFSRGHGPSYPYCTDPGFCLPALHIWKLAEPFWPYLICQGSDP